MTGGTCNQDVNAGVTIGHAAGGAGILNVNGGLLTVSGANGNGVRVGENAPAALNLNGGTLATDAIIAGSSTGTVYFNGGTLMPTGSQSTAFFPGSANVSAYVGNGGAIVNTAGFNVTVAQPLLHSNLPGDNSIDGGLIKNGAGTMTLSGSNGYSGPTVINAGTLKLQGLPAGTVAFYAFNNSANLGQDSSGQGNNLTAVGTPVYSTSSAGGGSAGSVYLNGSSYFNSSTFPTSVPSGSSAYTISFWMDPDTTGGAANEGMVGWGNPTVNNANNVRMNGNNQIVNYWWTNDDTVTNPAGSLLGNWQYVTVTYNGTTRTIYLNGVSLGSQNPAAPAVAAANFFVGRTINAPDGSFKGYLDDVLIANTALGPAQITALMNNGGCALNLPAGTALQIASGGTLDLAGASPQAASLADVGGAGGSVVNSAAGTTSLLTLSATGGATTFSGQIAGGGLGVVGLAVGGNGVQVLAGSNTYTGGTTLLAGELSIASDANIGGPTSGITFAGGTLQVTGASLANLDSHAVNWSSFNGGLDIASAANSFTVSESLAGTGSLAKLGPGTLVLAGTNSHSGGTTISGGTLLLGNNSALGTGGLTANNGTVDLAGFSPTIASLSGVSGTITNNGGSALLTVSQSGATSFGGTLQDGSGQTSLTMNGSGTLTLSGPNTFSGTVHVENGNGAGQIIAANPLALQNANLHDGNDNGIGFAANITGATLGSIGAASAATQDLTLSNGAGGAVTLAVGNNGGNGTYSGRFLGNGGLDKIGSGSLTLQGVSSNSGPNTVNAGTLVLAGGAAFGSGGLLLNGGTLAGAISGGTISGLVQAGGAAHTVAPGAGLPSGQYGTLNLNGGLATNANTTLAFNMNLAPRSAAASTVSPSMPAT